MVLSTSVNDAAFGQVVRREFDSDFVARKNTNVVFTHLSRNMRSHNMTVFEFYAKSRVWKRLVNDTFHLNGFFFRQGLKVLSKKGPRIVQKSPALCNASDR